MPDTYVDVLFSDIDGPDAEYLVTVSQFNTVEGMIALTDLEQIQNLIDKLEDAKMIIEKHQYGY